MTQDPDKSYTRYLDSYEDYSDRFSLYHHHSDTPLDTIYEMSEPSRSDVFNLPQDARKAAELNFEVLPRYSIWDDESLENLYSPQPAYLFRSSREFETLVKEAQGTPPNETDLTEYPWIQSALIPPRASEDSIASTYFEDLDSPISCTDRVLCSPTLESEDWDVGIWGSCPRHRSTAPWGSLPSGKSKAVRDEDPNVSEDRRSHGSLVSRLWRRISNTASFAFSFSGSGSGARPTTNSLRYPGPE